MLALLLKNLRVRSHNVRFCYPTKYLLNAHRLHHDRNCSQNRNVIITTHNRQKHRKYLGELILSPPQSVKDHCFYYKTAHAQIIVSGFESNVFLNNILISAYSKCDSLGIAVALFDRMPKRSLISWSSMISALNKNGRDEEALNLFMMFRSKGVCETPNEYVLASVIQSCTHLLDVEKGLILHAWIIKGGYQQNAHVGSSLVEFYTNSGDLNSARLVYDGLREKNVVTYTSIIAGYASIGKIDVSLSLFREMLKNGILPDMFSLSSVLNACSIIEFLEGGKQVHAYVLRSGGDVDMSVSNLLLDFYLKCGESEISYRIFESMTVKNHSTWTMMICGCMQIGFDREAIEFFKEMYRFGYKPDEFACSSVFTSCGSLKALKPGMQVHAYTIKISLYSDEFVMNTLIDMYCKCNSLVDARKVLLHASKVHSTACYNMMIEGYSRHEKLNDGFNLFYEMRCKSIKPCEITLVALLGLSSASKLSLEVTKQLHSLMIRYGFSLSSFSGSALTDVYSKLSLLRDARLAFDEVTEKDIVVWNSMLFGYVLRSEKYEALRLFVDLLHSKERPNAFTFVSIIMTSSDLTSSLHCSQFHTQSAKTGLDLNPLVTNALIDAYAKCGDSESANSLFNLAVNRDLACWNTIISMHARRGDARKALNTFQNMKAEGINPDHVTFVIVLSACAHVGLAEEGFECFESMIKLGIEPREEHYACMVSLLGRAGKLYEAKMFIERMHIRPSAVIWKSLLSACRDYGGDLELVRFAADMAVLSDPRDRGSYVLLSNIFAAENMWISVEETREIMRKCNVVKEIGHSWIST